MAAYNVPDYAAAARFVPRIARFHFASVLVGAGLIGGAIVYRKFFAPSPAGFPWYFIYLSCASFIPAAGFFKTARDLINWRTFSFTFFLVLFISLLWEVTLALPFGWWDYKPAAMMGLEIGASSRLPVEAPCVWLAVTFTTVIVYDVIKICKASAWPLARHIASSQASLPRSGQRAFCRRRGHWRRALVPNPSARFLGR